MKTAMDYVKERDERVDVAGKTARLKEWCEKFFDDKSWDIRDEGEHAETAAVPRQFCGVGGGRSDTEQSML